MKSRYLGFTLLAVPFLVLAFVLPYKLIHEQNLKNSINNSIQLEISNLSHQDNAFAKPVTFCKWGYRSLSIRCSGESKSIIRYEFQMIKESMADKGWRVSAERIGNPNEGYLRLASLSKDNLTSTIREVDGPGSAEVTISQTRSTYTWGAK